MKGQRGGEDDAPAIEHEQQDARGVQDAKTLYTVDWTERPRKRFARTPPVTCSRC